MQFLVVVSILLLFGIPLSIAIRRSTELFVIRVKSGRVYFRRGRIPHQLLGDIEDILRQTSISGTIKVVVERHAAVLSAQGPFSSGTQQQLRNAIGVYPLARIRAGTRPKRR